MSCGGRKTGLLIGGRRLRNGNVSSHNRKKYGKEGKERKHLQEIKGDSGLEGGS